MADNTRKTSNIIHEVSDLKDQMDKIQDKIESIDIGDAYISTINNTKPDENGDIGIVDAGNVDVSKSGNNITLAVDLSGLADKGDIPTVNDGKINLQASNGVKLAAGSQNATANQSGTSTFKVEADLEYLNANLDIPEDKSAANDGQINMTGGTGIDVTGQNATANQANNTAWNVSIDNTVALKSDIPTIPPPVVPGDGSISLNAGDGMTVSGSNATANQDGNTAWTVKTDNTYLNANLDFAKPDDIPTQYVKDIQSGNLLTLTVDEEDGVYTLTAIGGGGSGGTGDIAFGEGQCIEIETETAGDLTTYIINCDLECLEANLNFVKPDDLPDIPDGTLPISSTDGTVTLDSPSANTFAIETASAQRLVVDSGKTSFKKGHYADFEDANGTVCGRVQSSSDRMMINALNDAEVWVQSNGIQYILVDPDKQTDGVKFAKGATTPFVKSPNADGANIALADEATLTGKTVSPLRLSSTTTSCFARYSFSGAAYSFFAGSTGTTFNIAGGVNGNNQLIIEPDDYVKIPTQLQTDTITSAVAASYVPASGTPGEDDYVPAVSGDVKLGLHSHLTVNANNGDTDEYLVAVFSSYSSQDQRGLQIKNGMNGNRANSHVILDAKSNGSLGKMTFQTDGEERLSITEDDIQAADGYEPQTDNSLVTKGWVTNTDGGIGTLPISSTDGTVTLDSPSANTFSIETGGDPGLVVDDQQRVGINCDPSFRFHAKDGSGEFLFAGTYAYTRQLSRNESVGFSSRNLSNVWTMAIEDGVADEAAWEIWSGSVGASGEHRFSFKKNGNFVVETAGASVQTPSVSGVADNDASINLGANLTVETGGETALSVGPYQTVGIGTAAGRQTVLHAKGTPNRDNSTGILSDLFQTVSKDDAFGFFQQLTINAADAVLGEFKAYFAKGLYGAGKATHYIGYQCEPIATGADNVTAFRSRVNVSATGGTNYAFYSEGSAVSHFNGALEVPRIVGSAAPATDASIQLGANLTVSTGGEERVKVKPASYGSAAVTIGEDHVQSIGGVSVKNDPTQVDYTSQMQMRFVDENGKYAYTGCTEPRFAFGGANALIDGGVFFAGHDNGNSVLFSKTDDVIIATGGLAASSERLRITDDAAVFNGQVQTNTITSKDAASGDASIELGANLTLDNKSGIIWLGSSSNAPAGTTNFLVGSSDGDGKNLLISSGQPKTAAEAGSGISLATVEGNGDRSRKTRMYISPEGYVGINDVALDERLCVAGNIKTNRLKGYLDNPQIILESQQALLNASDGSDYTPTQPSSIATKAYVDANAGGGGSSGVNKIIAGSNVTVSPLDGTGNVTVNAVVPDVGVTKIIGGTNVTVSPADGTGTVTINATSSGGGGADSLVDLDDVVVTDPKGNEVLTYDITTGKWINKAPPSGGNGGIIDGGQVPGTGSTFIWHDTKYSYLRSIDGEAVGGYYIPEQPRDMVAYDGVFSDGTFWTLDGVNLRIDPNATTGTTEVRYVGKFRTDNGAHRPWQGRVIAGQFGYWFATYFSQDMKQWGSSVTSGWNASDPYPCQQKQRPLSLSVDLNSQTGSYIYRYVSGTWEEGRVNSTVWQAIFPGASSQYNNKWTANQFSGQETAMAMETTVNGYDYKIYCLDVDPEDFEWNTSEDSKTPNDQVLKNGTTAIPALDGCTCGFYSERIEKWFFAKEGTVYISNTSSLKGGFITKTLPRTNAWDRCYDDGSSIVFARTGLGNSATVFSVDGGQEWKVSISLQNRGYSNFAGTNGRAMATYDDEDYVEGFIPDPADPSGEGVLPVTFYEWRYAVSGVDDPNPAEASTRNIKLTHPVSISSAKAIEAQTQEDANEIFTEEIQRRSPVMTLTQVEYDAIPADEIDDNTLYLITS